MPKPTQSEIWIYFQVDEHNPDKAHCKICNKIYSRKGRSTTSLKNHLRLIHPTEYSLFEVSNNIKQLQTIKTETDAVVTPTSPQQTEEQLGEVIVKNENWDNYDLDSEKIDKLIGEMIALQNLPFNFIEGTGFRRLLDEIAPRYHLRGRIFYADFVCSELYARVAEKVKELIEKFDYMSFTSNIWSDPSSNTSLLCLSCHGIAENFDRSSIVLKCEIFDNRQTGNIIIAEKFETMLSEWNIKTDKVHCLIRNEGFNSKQATRLVKVNDMDCIVLKIQMAIRSCLHSQENIKLVEQKCKKISSHFNHSVIARKQLQNIQDRLNQPHLNVFQGCTTRWNSTFHTFEHFLKVKDALSLYINDNEIDPILPQDWKLIECCVELLKPFEEATQELGSSDALISSIIPIIQMLNKKLDDYLTSSHDCDLIRMAVFTLKSELSVNFSTLLQDDNLLIIATYLDPRYKHKFFSLVTEEKIKEDILKMRNTDVEVSGFYPQEVKRMRMTYCPENDTEQPEMFGISKVLCLKNELALMLDSSSEDENQEISQNFSANIVLKKELLSYRKKKRLNINENPLEWWSIYRYELKILSSIARQFLSPRPASVPNEQLFGPLRNNLELEEAAKLLFIKHNAPVFKFIY